MLNVKKIREDFPILKEKMQGKNLVYFDSAATSLKPNCVIKAIEDYYSKYSANYHRGDYDLAFKVDEKISQCRDRVAKLINCESKEVVFTSGTSMSINLVAYGYAIKHLKKTDTILLSEEEHASNLLPWFHVKKVTGCKIEYIPLDKDRFVTVSNFKKAMHKGVKLVSLAQISNVLGHEVDIKSIAKIAHKFGAVVVCDGAQSVPHKKVDVKDLDVDFLAFSGHKMCGPTGIGVLFGKYDLLVKTEPFLTGGGMNDKIFKDGKVTLYDPPYRFEAGTINIAGIIGLSEAIDYLLKIGMDKIEEHERSLREYLNKKIIGIKDLVVYNPKTTTGIFAFNKKGIFAQDEATFLNSKGIAVRSGQHCAKLLNNVICEPATVRCSFYFYNTKEEIDYFVECLKKGDILDAYFN